MLKINQKIIIGIAIAVALLFIIVVSWVILRQAKEPLLEEVEMETIIERQLRELGQLREEGAVPLTEEEIKKQLEQLESLRVNN